jgi:hypothetical protein
MEAAGLLCPQLMTPQLGIGVRHFGSRILISARTWCKGAGAAVLLAISREFGKSVNWLLTGEIRPKKTTKDRTGVRESRLANAISMFDNVQVSVTLVVAGMCISFRRSPALVIWYRA